MHLWMLKQPNTTREHFLTPGDIMEGVFKIQDVWEVKLQAFSYVEPGTMPRICEWS